VVSSNKAVSDGAISFYLDHFVRSRIAKVTYGVHKRIMYESSNPEHLERSSKVYKGVDGSLYLYNVFDPLLSKARVNLCKRTTSDLFAGY